MLSNIIIADPHFQPLATIQRRALWHDTAGLVVSLNDCPLPSLEGRLSRRQPAYFDDAEIWQAFYANNAVFSAPIFDRLDYTAPQIMEKTIQVGPNTFSLPDSIIGEWSRLENALLDVADHSLGTHPRASRIPPITWPRNPHEYGYRRTHRSPQIVLRSAIMSRDAFHSLCAVVSFILSLCTHPGSCRGDPFKSAFSNLANRIHDPVNRSWLDRFAQTFVCKVSIGVRPGCFINPYTTVWGPWLANFVRAGVQVWVAWGPEVFDKELCISRLRYDFIKEFFPPTDTIHKARSRFEETQKLRLHAPFVDSDFPILPPVPSAEPSTSNSPPANPRTFHPAQSVGPPKPTYPPPSAEPPQPPPGSRQRRGETLAEFLPRLAEGKMKRMQSETLPERQARESREVSATEKGYSKSCTVFQWEEARGFYLRAKVNRSEVPAIWNDYPASRRVYNSHINEWDLCPPIPPFSDELTAYDLVDIQQYDDELDAFDNAPTTLKAPSDQYTAQHSGQMDELASLEPSTQPTVLTFDIVEHLKDRYGYDVHRRPSWTPNLHGQQVADVAVAKRHLLFESASHHACLAPAIENFCNILTNQHVRLHNLPPAWDLHNLRLESTSLRLSLGARYDDPGARLYVISSTTTVQAHWVICLHDPTTVLQIYRNRWTALDTIVRELISRGIPFNTGLPDPTPNRVEGRYRSKGLGLRPPLYQPRSDDYSAYVAARNDIFRSHLGRAALLKGGLIARLARDIVDVSDVLSGPDPSTSLQVGATGQVKLVDDNLSDYMLDVISGVYYVETETDPNVHQHLSWWPKYGVWCTSGFTEQWSADAETWYQSRLQEIANGRAKLYNSKDWKSSLRRYNTHTRRLVNANQRLAESVIDLHVSYAPLFWRLENH